MFVDCEWFFWRKPLGCAGCGASLRDNSISPALARVIISAVRTEDSPAAVDVDVAEDLWIPGLSTTFGACLWCFPRKHSWFSFCLKSRSVMRKLKSCFIDLNIQRIGILVYFTLFGGGLSEGRAIRALLHGIPDTEHRRQSSIEFLHVTIYSANLTHFVWNH
jgi:hypothetical protein